MSREVNSKNEELTVERVHCPDCAVKIEKNVAKIEGVGKADVDPGRGTLQVSYDPAKVNRSALEDSVTNIGYNVVHEGESEGFTWNEPEIALTGLAGLFLLSGLIASLFTSPLTLLSLPAYELSLSGTLYLAAVLSGGYFVARRGLAAARELSLDIDFLMTLALAGAVIIGEVMEAATLAFLYPLAEVLEDWASERARSSLKSLMDLSPQRVTVKREGEELTLPAEDVTRGERSVVRPGDKIGLDGRVITGNSSVDQSPITGESVPVEKSEGDEVYAGTINGEGYLEVEVTKESSQSTISRVIQMVREAQREKAPIERFVDRFADYYTPSVVTLAVIVASLFPLFFPGGFNTWFLRGITLLVIACPCALVISTPVTVVSSISSAAREGVLIKAGRYLEEMGKVRALAVDKTGTLTKGELEVTEVIAAGGYTESEVLRIAGSLEQASEHHLGRAILEKAREEDLELIEVSEFSSLTGKGVEGKLDGKSFRVGKEELFPQNELGEYDHLRGEGRTLVYVGTDERAVGLLAIRDQLKPGAKEVVKQLKERGVQPVMLTGDDERTARALASEAGIKRYYSGLLPEEKVERIKALSRTFGKVAMVGDGINDGPALAAADVGVAMGAAGTDVAMETADIALMTDDLTGLPYLLEIARRGERTIKQNIGISLLLKFGLGAAVFPGLVTLAMAVLIGDMGATFLVTGNALWLSRLKRNS